jgi:hypothetical protein
MAPLPFLQKLISRPVVVWNQPSRDTREGSVAPATIVFGLLMTALGLGGYFYTDRVAVTSLIPAFFGIAFLLLGWLGLKGNLRKHAMHAAAALALIGFVMTALRIPYRALLAGDPVERPAAVVETAIMSGLCLVFVGLCVRSFIAARRARSRSQATQ